MKMPFANDGGTIHGARPERVRHHVIRVETQEEIGKHRVVINFVTLFRGESGEVIAPQLTVLAHGLCATLKFHGAADVSTMRLVVVPGEVVADGAERRMQYGTVQALVVVLHDQLPV